MPEFPETLVRALQEVRGRTGAFHLAGGTALSMFYLHHRVSYDLDFFCAPGRLREREALLRAWAEAGMRVLAEGEGPPGAAPAVRYRLLYGAGESKVDFVEDPLPLLARPEAFEGIPVMGVDDIYDRKIRIGRSRPATLAPGRVEPRDLIDVHALHRRHAALEKRILDSGFDGRAIQEIQWWLDHFRKRDVAREIRRTRYGAGTDAAGILREIGESLALALSRRLGRERGGRR